MPNDVSLHCNGIIQHVPPWEMMQAKLNTRNEKDDIRVKRSDSHHYYMESIVFETSASFRRTGTSHNPLVYHILEIWVTSFA